MPVTLLSVSIVNLNRIFMDFIRLSSGLDFEYFIWYTYLLTFSSWLSTSQLLLLLSTKFIKIYFFALYIIMQSLIVASSAVIWFHLNAIWQAIFLSQSKGSVMMSGLNLHSCFVIYVDGWDWKSAQEQLKSTFKFQDTKKSKCWVIAFHSFNQASIQLKYQIKNYHKVKHDFDVLKKINRNNWKKSDISNGSQRMVFFCVCASINPLNRQY